MKNVILAAAIVVSSAALAACGGGASENLSTTNQVVADDLNVSDSLDEDAYANDAALNSADYNTLGPIDDPALANGAAPLDNTVANAL
jgi:ABC-type oligopeptide transport system substrate-binding subunit